MVKDFCDLDVWKKAHQIALRLYKLTKNFPKEEMFGLTNQLRRSINSICANIAEGFSRYHTKDKIKFYHNARGSLSESKNHVLLAQDIGYISTHISRELIEELENIKKMLNGMINSIRNRSNTLHSP